MCECKCGSGKTKHDKSAAQTTARVFTQWVSARAAPLEA
jgi:hypothetical protein